MKTANFILTVVALLAYAGTYEAYGQWNYNGNLIYNTNTGNVGIGTSTPSTLLYAAKNITEPTITIRNSGGFGGATFSMKDDASGADWKFKATLSGGFKIRDNSSNLDVLSIEPGSFADAICIKSTGNIGIGTASPDISAFVEMASVSKGFLPPRMTQSQISAIANPGDGLMVYCTSDEKFYLFTSSLASWKELLYGTAVIAPPFQCGNTLLVNHVAGNVAPVSKSVSYGTATGIAGEPAKCWITRNLGADQVAAAVTDASEPSAGWYWQFNRKQGYKNDGVTVTPAWTLTSISENNNWLGSEDPCALLLGAGWRIPTSTEWNNIDAVGGWSNYNGPYGSALKIHAAGYLNSFNGSMVSRGSDGQYWSSDQAGNTTGSAFFTGINYCNVGSGDKALGFSVRCLQ